MQRMSSAVVVGAMLAVAGTTMGSDFFDGSGNALDRPVFDVADCPDGDMPVATLHAPASRFDEVLAALNAELGAGSAERALEASFVSTGEGVEADSHSDVEYLPDGSAYVLANRASNNLVLFDSSDRSLIGEVALSGPAQALAISSDGAIAVTANLDGTASVVDLVSLAEVAVIETGTLPGAVRISPDDSFAVVNNTVDQTLSVIDLATNTVTGTVPATVAAALAQATAASVEQVRQPPRAA